MWKQYRKTFAGMQIVILIVSAMVYELSGHSIANTVISHLAMQLASVLGALWAVRLKTALSQKREQLPLTWRG